MKVSLINFTSDPLKAMYISARTCYSEDPPTGIGGKLPSEKKMIHLIEKVLSSGHWSIAEHVSFTFAIEGVSRVLSHQLVRHRIGIVFSQKSQRYVDGKNFKYITPKTIGKNSKLNKKYMDLMEKIREFYQEAQNFDVPNEDARFALPNATVTDLTMTCNFRELAHIYDLRACGRAQWEIRGLAKELKAVVKEKFPFLADFLKIRCEKLGYCPDIQSCGKYPTKKEKEGKIEG